VDYFPDLATGDGRNVFSAAKTGKPLRRFISEILKEEA